MREKLCGRRAPARVPANQHPSLFFSRAGLAFAGWCLRPFTRFCLDPSMDTKRNPFFIHLRCRECGRSYPKQAIHICEFDFGPLEAAYDYDAIGRALTREQIMARPQTMWRYRELLPIDGEPEVGPQVGLHAAGAGGPARPAAGLARALHQERHRQLPHPVLQGSRRFGGVEPRAGAGSDDRRLRVHGQPRQFRRGPGGGGRLEKLRAHPGRSGERQGARIARVRDDRDRHPRRVRSGQPALLGDSRANTAGGSST